MLALVIAMQGHVMHASAACVTSGRECPQDQLAALSCLLTKSGDAQAIASLSMGNIKLSIVCVVFAVLPALTALLIKQSAPNTKWDRTAPYVVLSDGRHLAYEVRGNASSRHTAIYIHGTPSCRQESLAMNEGVLDSVSLRLIAVDKPGYGQSDFHYGRSLQSFVDDLEELADHLKLQRFFLIGVSGGGPYSWAVARYAPHRVQAILIFSGAGNTGSSYKSLTPVLSEDASDFDPKTS